MKTITFILCFTSAIGFSQTRLISHKSHSGSSTTFSTALENSLFDITASNFGDPGSEMRLVVDSVILLPDNRAIVISSEKDVWVTAQKSTIAVRPGRDTLYNVMLSDRHNKDSIMQQLRWQGSHSPVLINYDNEKPLEAKKFKNKKNLVLPGSAGDDNFPDKPMMVFALVLLSGILAFITYYFYKFKNTISAI